MIVIGCSGCQSAASAAPPSPTATAPPSAALHKRIMICPPWFVCGKHAASPFPGQPTGGCAWPHCPHRVAPGINQKRRSNSEFTARSCCCLGRRSMAKVAPRTWLALWDSVPVLRRGALAVALGIYAFASLEPFDWQLPRQVANRAEQTPDGWRFAAPGIALAPPPHDWLEAARAAETLELSLTVRPHSATQAGPARILTISRDTHMRNLTLGQEGDDLVLRLRTEDTDLNGLIAGEPFARVEDVFRSGRWLTIDLRIEPGRLS